MSVATTILVGRLGGDPESFETQNGTNGCNFNVAVDKGTGENQKTIWYRCTAWGKTAENCCQYLVKGRQVYVEGSMNTNEHEGKIYWNLDAFRVVFLGAGENSSSSPRGNQSQTPQHNNSMDHASHQAQQQSMPQFTEGDVPF